MNKSKKIAHLVSMSMDTDDPEERQKYRAEANILIKQMGTSELREMVRTILVILGKITSEELAEKVNRNGGEFDNEDKQSLALLGLARVAVETINDIPAHRLVETASWTVEELFKTNKKV